VLSGSRDDGTAGLAEIKRHGGVALVQDPREAEYADMPAHAIAGAAVDGVLPAAAIGPELVRLAAGTGMMLERSGGRRASDAPDPEEPTSMLAAHAVGVEQAMWTAARSLEDRAALLRRMAERARGTGNGRTAQQFEHTADEALEQAGTIRVAIVALDDAGPAAIDTSTDAEATG
jgi:two-component system chemotaxis response regulator CheB